MDEQETMSMDEALSLVKPVPGAERRPQQAVPTMEATTPDVSDRPTADDIPWRNPAMQQAEVEVPAAQPPVEERPIIDSKVVAAKDAQISALEREIEAINRQKFEAELAALPEEQRTARKLEFLESQLREKELRIERQEIRAEFPAATALFGLVAPELALTVEDANQLRSVYSAMDGRFSDFLSAYRQEIEAQVEARLQAEYAEAWGTNSRLGWGNVSPSSVNSGGGPKPPAVAEYEQLSRKAAETGAESDMAAMIAAHNRLKAMQLGR